MPGHMGNEPTTVQNLDVVKVDPKELPCGKGRVPGPKAASYISRIPLKTVKPGMQGKEKANAESYFI